MQNIIKRLPFDIILKIIPYTYQFQNKNLLDDIINYKEIKDFLLELYHKIWIINMQSQDSEEDKNWLINNIFSYANNYNAIMHGYVDSFYNIFKRHIFLKTNEDIDNYIDKLKHKQVSSQINIFLGLFTIEERNEVFIHSLIVNDIENNN